MMYRTSTYAAILSIRPASYVVPIRAVGVSPRAVTFPQLFFRFGFLHHHGTLWSFTTVRISRQSYSGISVSSSDAEEH